MSTSLPQTGPTAGTDSGSTDGDASMTGVDASADHGDTQTVDDSTDDGSSTENGTSTGDTGEASPCAVAGAEVWQRYAYRLTTQTWDAPQPLDQLWVGDAAPPPRGIVAAAATGHSQRLFIITEVGCLHERVGAQWVEMPLSDRFAETAGSYTNVAAAAEWPEHDEVAFIDNPTARVYELDAGGDIMGEPLVVTLEDERGAAPRGTGTAMWGFAVTDPSLIDVSAWYDSYTFYDDGMLYWLNAGTGSAPGMGWSSHPAVGGSNPFFQGTSPNEPDPHQVQAAYYAASADRVYFVAP